MDNVTLRRFWSKVDKTGDCWLWTGGLSDGYGRFKRNGKHQLAHRVSWLIEHGYMPEENVLHKCDNPACVNPAHLFVGSQSDNMRDAAAKGRTGKINQSDTDEIRRLVKAGVKRRDVARQFGISQSHISNIVMGIVRKEMK